MINIFGVLVRQQKKERSEILFQTFFSIILSFLFTECFLAITEELILHVGTVFHFSRIDTFFRLSFLMKE